jgi:hypothetical protein
MALSCNEIFLVVNCIHKNKIMEQDCPLKVYVHLGRQLTANLYKTRNFVIVFSKPSLICLSKPFSVVVTISPLH